MKTTLICLIMVATTMASAQTPPLGHWEWYETETSQGVFVTPADVGYTVQVSVVDGGTFIEYRDEAPYAQGTWTVFLSEYMGMDITAFQTVVGGATTTYAYSFGPPPGFQLYAGADAGGWPSYPIERYSSRGPVQNDETTWGELKILYR